jgi:protein-disulfide isomerase
VNKRLATTVIVACGILIGAWSFRVSQRLTTLEMRSVATAPAPQQDTVVVSLKGVSLGASTAPVTLVMFTDYECPFCRRFAEETLPELMTRFIEPGKLRLVIRDLPIRQIHPNALTFASAARCGAAIKHEAFNDLHMALYRGGDDPLETLRASAEAGGVDFTTLSKCVEQNRFLVDIEHDEAEARVLGVRSTPTFIIGRSTRGKDVRGQVIRGARPTEEFVAAVEALL